MLRVCCGVNSSSGGSCEMSGGGVTRFPAANEAVSVVHRRSPAVREALPSLSARLYGCKRGFHRVAKLEQTFHVVAPRRDIRHAAAAASGAGCGRGGCGGCRGHGRSSQCATQRLRVDTNLFIVSVVQHVLKGCAFYAVPVFWNHMFVVKVRGRERTRARRSSAVWFLCTLRGGRALSGVGVPLQLWVVTSSKVLPIGGWLSWVCVRALRALRTAKCAHSTCTRTLRRYTC
jgi:hypothetical protein